MLACRSPWTEELVATVHGVAKDWTGLSACAHQVPDASLTAGVDEPSPAELPALHPLGSQLTTEEKLGKMARDTGSPRQASPQEDALMEM